MNEKPENDKFNEANQPSFYVIGDNNKIYEDTAAHDIFIAKYNEAMQLPVKAITPKELSIGEKLAEIADDN